MTTKLQKLLYLSTMIYSVLVLDYPKVTNYNDIIDATTIVSAESKIFKMYDGYARFKVEPVNCGSKLCQFPIIEVTNHNNGNDHIKSLPTIVLVSGFSHIDMVGVNALIGFLYRMLKSYQFDLNDTFLFDNFRFFVLPMANPYGIYNGTDVEYNEPIDKYGKPHSDFPIYKGTLSTCFVTTAAQVLHELYQENIIIGTLVFQQGDFVIAHPWSKTNENIIKTPDINFMNFLGVEMAKYLNEAPKEFDMEFSNGSINDLAEKIKDSSSRNFEDWAFSFSWNSENINKTCANNKIEIIKNDTTVSNRSLVLLIQTGKDNIFTAADWLLEEFNKLMFKLIERFAYVIRPQFEVNYIGFNLDSDSAMIGMRIYGCSTIDKIIMNASNDDNFFTLKEYKSGFEASLETNMLRISERNSKDISFAIECGYNTFLDTKSKTTKSHFLNSLQDPSYKVKTYHYTYSYDRKVPKVIYNVFPNIDHTELAFLHNFGTHTELMYEKYLIAEFSDFKALLSYYPLTKQMNIIIVKLYNNANISTENFSGIFIRQYGEIGCCGSETMGEILLKSREAEFEDISLKQYYNLIGRGIEIVIDTDKKHYYSTIEISKRTNQGYYMPYSGLSCSNFHARTHNNYYYVHIQNEDNNVLLKLFTSEKHLKYIILDNIQYLLKKPEKFETAKFETIYEYKLLLNKYEYLDSDNFYFKTISKLRGQRIYFISKRDQETFSCGLGFANPSVNERDNLQYSFKNLNVSGYKKTQKKSIQFFLFISICILVFLCILGAVAYCRLYVGKRKLEKTIRRVRPKDYL